MRYYYEEKNNGITKEKYLVCHMEDEVLHNFTYPMLGYNQIFGLVKPEYQNFRQDCRRLVYNVTDCITVKDYLEYYGDAEILENTYRYINTIKDSIAAYGISERTCLWDFNYMYVNYYTGDIYVICVPVDVFVGYSLPDFMLKGNLRECLSGGRVESMYPYLDEVEDEGETTVLCMNEDPFVVKPTATPRFKVFGGDASNKKAKRAIKFEDKRSRRLAKKEERKQRKLIMREEGFSICQIPSLT